MYLTIFREDVNQTTGETIPRMYFSGGVTLKTGLVLLATSLSVWLAPTPAQAVEIAQSAKPVGQEVIVEGLANEVNPQGRPILPVQTNTSELITRSSTTAEQLSKKTTSGSSDSAVMAVNEFQTWWRFQSIGAQLGIGIFALYIGTTLMTFMGRWGIDKYNDRKINAIKKFVAAKKIDRVFKYLNADDMRVRAIAGKLWMN